MHLHPEQAHSSQTGVWVVIADLLVHLLVSVLIIAQRVVTVAV
jgi:hypothetical protein